jgi:hypothetical protein
MMQWRLRPSPLESQLLTVSSLASASSQLAIKVAGWLLLLHLRSMANRRLGVPTSGCQRGAGAS